MPSHPLAQTLQNGFDRLSEAILAQPDTIFANDFEAQTFLHVSKDVFEADYKRCGVKQGNSMTYLKSDLLRRREQVRMEQAGTR